MPLGKRFSKDYQPDPVKKSKAIKEFWEYRRARGQMFEKLCNIEMPDGSKLDFWEKVKERIHFLVLDKKSNLDHGQQAELILKLCKEFMPETKQIELDASGPIHIHFDKDDSKL